MPRKNKHKVQSKFHRASIYDNCFKTACYGCAFAGRDSKCMTSDGKCLKIKPESKERENAQNAARTD